MQVAVYAPATSANLSVGFDLLGLAVRRLDGKRLGDIVVAADFSEQDTNLARPGEPALAFAGKGKFIGKLADKLETNLVYKAYVLYRRELQARDHEVKPLALTLYKNMPVGSGLGSSSSSAVAALVALNEFHGQLLEKTTMLALMGELEGTVSGSAHYDNVAPAYLGGLQLMLPPAYAPYPGAPERPVKEGALTQELPIFEQWYWVLAYPGIVIKTEDARRILPDSYSRSQIIAQTAYMASFVHALYLGDQELAARSLRDLVAEPYREQLLPNADKIRTLLYQAGALACGISGSGPTFYALANNLATAQKLQEVFAQHYLQNEEGFVYICQTDFDGAVVLSEQEFAQFLRQEEI
ncbi:homoserine kinase [Psittacicella melopsittaci]|uniref:Homoserine kinase n=1 Tax=Psittacicella melopsittaci TaxID=2028576 RepID=A0A3A1Y5T9_9GAMM|nr:homoserine kinase [Psittacicella melopsittaci]RIY33623.1 homoserine kinase [Psittacicella melopsittaci]